jgi:hypothetical protein
LFWATGEASAWRLTSPLTWAKPVMERMDI